MTVVTFEDALSFIDEASQEDMKDPDGRENTPMFYVQVPIDFICVRTAGPCWLPQVTLNGKLLWQGRSCTTPEEAERVCKKAGAAAVVGIIEEFDDDTSTD